MSHYIASKDTIITKHYIANIDRSIAYIRIFKINLLNSEIIKLRNTRQYVSRCFFQEEKKCVLMKLNTLLEISISLITLYSN